MRQFAIVVVHIAAEIGRIVRVQGDVQSLPQHLRHGVVLQILNHAQLQVRQRAHRQRHPLGRQAPHQRFVLHGAVAVIHPVDVQQVQRLVHIGGRALLAGVRDALQAQRARTLEHPLELGRRMADLRRVQSHARDPVQPWRGRLQRRERRRFVQVTQEAQDQPGGDAQLSLRPRHAGQQALDHLRHRHASVGVGLGVEEDFGVPHGVGRRALEVGEGQVLEVTPGQQHRRPRIVDVQEVLQVREVVGRPHRLHAVERDRHAVAPRQLEHQLGLQRPLDVQVQLGLGQAGDEGVEMGFSHADRLPAAGRTRCSAARPHICASSSCPR